MKTFSAKPAEVTKKWGADRRQGSGGRPARFARRECGCAASNLPTYTPHVDCGDHVIIVNAAHVVLTGRKRDNKVYYNHTGFIGGIKERTAKSILEGRFPERVVEKAVERMIPRGPLGPRAVRQSARLSRARASARGPATRNHRHRCDETART